MNRRDELAATLGAWFEAESASPAPHRLFEAVAEQTASLRPRSGWPARLRGDGLRRSGGAQPARFGPLLPIAALVVISVAGIGIIGGGLRGFPSVTPSPSPHDATFEPTLSGQASPVLEPSLSRDVAVQIASQAWADEAVGLVRDPITITKVELLAPGRFYPHPDGVGGRENDFLAWAVEADGTFVSCVFSCKVFDHAVAFIDDATGDNIGSSGAGLIMPVPGISFRRVLADHGLAYSPLDAPTEGIVDSATVVANLDPSVFALKPRLLVGPMYGVISIADAERWAAAGPVDVGPVGSGTRAIWWVQTWWTSERDANGVMGMEQGPWVAVDAVTGQVLMFSGSVVLWADYAPGLQAKIDALLACGDLQMEFDAAFSGEAEVLDWSGHDNAALKEYIQDRARTVRCPGAGNLGPTTD